MLYDYFSAADDEAAVTALDPEVWWADDVGFDSLFTKGIDPAAQMVALEHLLTGRPPEEVLANPRSALMLALVPDEGELCVVTLTDTLADALAATDEARLREVAVPWSQAEEFDGQADPHNLANFLTELSALARRAAERRHRLYCRWGL
jgi:hypothetical protein